MKKNLGKKTYALAGVAVTLAPLANPVVNMMANAETTDDTAKDVRVDDTSSSEDTNTSGFTLPTISEDSDAKIDSSVILKNTATSSDFTSNNSSSSKSETDKETTTTDKEAQTSDSSSKTDSSSSSESASSTSSKEDAQKAVDSVIKAATGKNSKAYTKMMTDGSNVNLNDLNDTDAWSLGFINKDAMLDQFSDLTGTDLRKASDPRLRFGNGTKGKITGWKSTNVPGGSDKGSIFTITVNGTAYQAACYMHNVFAGPTFGHYDVYQNRTFPLNNLFINRLAQMLLDVYKGTSGLNAAYVAVMAHYFVSSYLYGNGFHTNGVNNYTNDNSIAKWPGVQTIVNSAAVKKYRYANMKTWSKASLSLDGAGSKNLHLSTSFSSDGWRYTPETKVSLGGSDIASAKFYQNGDSSVQMVVNNRVVGRSYDVKNGDKIKFRTQSKTSVKFGATAAVSNKIPKSIDSFAVTGYTGTYQSMATLEHGSYSANVKITGDGADSVFDLNLAKHDADGHDTGQGDAHLNGALFKLTDSTGKDWGTKATDSHNNASWDSLPYGTYTLQETKAPTGYRGSADDLFKKTFTVTPNDVDKNLKYAISATNKVKTAKLHIYKYRKGSDSDDGQEKPMEGVKFDFELVSGNQFWYDGKLVKTATITTDAQGNATTKNLPYGTYAVQEQHTDGIRDIDPFTIAIGDDNGTNSNVDISVKTDETGEKKIMNESTKRALQLVKGQELADGTVQPINQAGIGFTIYRKSDYDKDPTTAQPVLWTLSDGTKTKELFTDASGIMQTPTNLKYIEGGYVAIETTAPKGYVKSTKIYNFNAPVQQDSGPSDAMINLNITNIPEKGRIKLTKMGEKVVGTDVKKDDVTGKDVSSIKYDKTPLAGATFEVKAAEDVAIPTGGVIKKGQPVDTITSGEDGTVESKYLWPGKYELVETKAPDGYKLDTKAHPVEIKFDEDLADSDPSTEDLIENGTAVAIKDTEIEIDNKLNNLNLKIYKEGEELKNYVDEQTGFTTETKPLAGITFGVYASDDIKDADGKVLVKKDTLVAVSTTGADGIAKIQAKFPEGKFYAKELKTDDRHVLTDGKFEFEYKTVDNSEQTINLYGDGYTNGEADSTKTPIQNYLYRTRFQIRKLAEKATLDGDKGSNGYKYSLDKETPAKGTVFTLTDSKGKFVQKMTVDETNTATSNELPVGTYTLKETKAPSSSYILDDSEYKVVIKKVDDKTGKVTISDSKGKELSSQLVDIDKIPHEDMIDYTKQKMVTLDDTVTDLDGNVISEGDGAPEGNTVADDSTDATTDGTVEAKTTEGETPDEVADEETPDEVADGDATTDGETDGTDASTNSVDLTKVKDDSSESKIGTEKIPQFTFKNYLKKGDFLFEKKDVATGKNLPGAKIEITGVTNDTKITYTTKSTATKFKLPEGTYKFKEIQAPNGYEKTAEVGTFTIKDKKITKAILHNKRTVKTGSNMFTGLASVIGGLVAMAGAGLWTLNKRNKKEVK